MADVPGSARSLLAFDPGGVHVGISAWSLRSGGWAPEWSVERGWLESVDAVLNWLDDDARIADVIAYETFRLRGGATALAQTGKTFPEVELIGVIRAVTRRLEVPLVGVEPSIRAAAVKRANALGYKWAARGHGGHARDAEAVAICALDLRAADLARLAR